jgi:hypothetical protein
VIQRVSGQEQTSNDRSANERNVSRWYLSQLESCTLNHAVLVNDEVQVTRAMDTSIYIAIGWQ